MSSKNAYPWFFFYRTARLTLVVFLPTLFMILFLYRSSYQSGLVAQMSSQMQEELKLINHTLKASVSGWESWCRTLPVMRDTQYSLVKIDGTVVCDSLDKKNEGTILLDQGDILEAKKNTFATDLRKSLSFGTQSVFSAMKINHQLYIRKIIPVSALKNNMNRFDRVLFLRIVPFALLSFILYIFLFYRSTRPLGVILTKVEKFKYDIPFNKSLELLYEKDEWSAIEEALNKADQRLQLQVEEWRLENEKNAAILESINDAIIAVDKYESILFFNRLFENSFIKKDDGQTIKRKIWHIFTDDVLKAFQHVLKTGEPQSLKRMNFCESHSPEKFFDLTITPLKSANGTNGALGVFYDVTEFKLTEQMRVDFVANVSHEIRTPLTSIKGFTQILQGQRDKLDESLHPFLDKIIANTERMISLFNELLNLSVIESKNLLVSENFPLKEMVEEVEDNILASYHSKKVSFSHNLEKEQLFGDFRLIEQVILNLCDNACKYAGDSVHININSYEKNEKSYVEISDNGPGISKEHLPRIFERFYRVDASRENLRGTGLGLAIVKQIISKHKGRIWAESDGLGTGTKFVIELPLI